MAKIDQNETEGTEEPNNNADPIADLPEVNAVEVKALDVNPDYLEKIKQILRGSEAMNVSPGNAERVGKRPLVIPAAPEQQPPTKKPLHIGRKKINLHRRGQLKPQIVEEMEAVRQRAFAVFEGKLKAAEMAIERHTTDGIIQKPLRNICDDLPLVLSPEKAAELFARSRTELLGSVDALRNGDIDVAWTGLHWSIAYSPTFTAYICRAGISYERGMYGACIADCTDALALAPGDVLALALRALVYIRLGNHRAAFGDCASAALETAPAGNSSGLDAGQRRDLVQALEKLLSAEHQWTRWLAPPKERKADPPGPRSVYVQRMRSNLLTSMRSTFIPIREQMEALRRAGKVVDCSVGSLPPPTHVDPARNRDDENTEPQASIQIGVGDFGTEDPGDDSGQIGGGDFGTKLEAPRADPPRGDICVEGRPTNAANVDALARIFGCIALPTQAGPDRK